MTSVRTFTAAVLATEELQPPFIPLRSSWCSGSRCSSLCSVGCDSFFKDSMEHGHFQKSHVLFSLSSIASVLEKQFFFSLCGVVGDGAQQVLEA